MYSPDPYVTVQVLGTPNGVKRTQHVKDSSDPQWAETLQFYIDPERDRLLGERLREKQFVYYEVEVRGNIIFPLIFVILSIISSISNYSYF